ncbi:hypothetical protein AB833_31285 [Chromatiales bacterium (ex Bugula neritina AB1)]|nr:hypothetical protein AB833_31285 [Chromatiales bacterium (ex Bugula neritina AB1)]
MTPKIPIFRLKREAKALSREASISHTAALDRIARKHGYNNWSLLAGQYDRHATDRVFINALQPGDMALVAGRPGHGKTLYTLRMLVHAIRQGRQAWFFTLVWNLQDLLGKLEQIGEAARGLQEGLRFDNSDDICSGYIRDKLADSPRNTVVVIDYLQVLDQQREKPDLQSQILDLKSFAVTRGVNMLFISQIDRRFELSRKAQPDLNDIRLPNPLSLNAFSKACFIVDSDLSSTVEIVD